MIHIQFMQAEKWHGKPTMTFLPAPERMMPSHPGEYPGDVLFLPDQKRLLVSLGKTEKITNEIIRRACGSAVRWMMKNNQGEIGVDIQSLDGFSIADEEALDSVVEGLLLGGFTFDIYKSGKKTGDLEVKILTKKTMLLQKALEAAIIRSEAVNLARSWAHEPANMLNPVNLSERIREIAKTYGLKCRILDDKQLERLGAGAIVAVGKASVTPSRLIILEYGGMTKDKPVVLVGKSLTFDTGGYTIKTAEGLVGMKYDKCGGMAVIATLVAAARLRLKTPIVGIIPAAENAISGNGYRPNDILKTLSGKTVEIVSTDAEGRLILCDALTYATRKYSPRMVIDLATLTGGVGIALGDLRAGLFANDVALADSLFQAGERTNERLWRLPMDDEYFEMLKSDDADMKNSTGIRKAHPIIGAIFLKQFIPPDLPWAHLDIASTATTDKELPYCPKGATGFGVRLLLDYLQTIE